MIDFKQELQIILFKKGLSMSRLTKNLAKAGIWSVNIASFSRMLSQKTLKLETAQIILDFLGYEIEIKEKKH